MQYSNFRKEFTSADWPTGSYRTTAIFSIEANKKGERAVRVTYHPVTGRPNAPKKTTYDAITRIADGEDGRTYIVSYTSLYGFISVMQSNLQFQQETIHEKDPRFTELLEQLKNS